MTKSTGPRYAVYYAPQTTDPWWHAGSQWLGRCAATGQANAQAPVPGICSQTLAALTAAPRRYGWHATLKAPFALAPGAELAQLEDAIGTLAGGLAAFDMPALRVQRLDDFLALAPQADEGASHAALQHLAAACVQQLAPWAAPLTEADLHRRRLAGLTPNQDALLVRWGYPYVFEEFRFHCSLTGSLAHASEAQVQDLMQAAEAVFHALPPARCETLALFEEPAPGVDFRLVRHFGLQA